MDTKVELNYIHETVETASISIVSGPGVMFASGWHIKTDCQKTGIEK